jgi:hypothetical protein
MTVITITKDLRSMFGPVRDQGQRPTCLAFAVSDLHAAMRSGWSPLSCEYVFYHAQKRAKRTPAQGALLPEMLEALRYEGQPLESGWEYLDSLPADLTLYAPPAGISPIYRRAGESGDDTVKTIIDKLDAGQPVLTLMRLSSSFDWVKADGIVDPGPNEAPDYFRRHAVVAVGYGELKGQRVVLIRNSWGDGWGASGYGWLTEKFLLPRVFRLAILKEDLSVSPHSHAA